MLLGRAPTRFRLVHSRGERYTFFMEEVAELLNRMEKVFGEV